VLTTPSYPPGVWLFTYQATVYFATSPSSLLALNSYISGPTTSVVTVFGRITTGTSTLSGSNQVVSVSSSACATLTASTAITLYVLINANATAQSGGSDTANVQATYITATRIG